MVGTYGTTDDSHDTHSSGRTLTPKPSIRSILANTLSDEQPNPIKPDDEIVTTDDILEDLEAHEEDPLLGLNHELPPARSRAITELLGEGNVKTTWQRELRIMLGSTTNQMVNFYLTASCAAVSLLFVGHLGRAESAGTALATMTYNITGLALLFGIGAALDTLASQAYGAGKKHLVGLHVQRVTLLNWACVIPIAVMYVMSPLVLKVIIADKEVAELAGQSLRIVSSRSETDRY